MALVEPSDDQAAIVPGTAAHISPVPVAHSSGHQRYAPLDTQLFDLSQSISPEQVQRALQAHLAETERRIQDASRLGTTLIGQRRELSERLKDVEKHLEGSDISPELRQKLLDIEQEYNDIGRDSARAYLPRVRATSSEVYGQGQGQSEDELRLRSESPSKFESQATSSPTKLTVPSRKQRNQPANRVHDIEFLTELSTSLLSQVRHFQGLVAERDESLRVAAAQKSQLEAESEGFYQRLQSLDESEHRYKDENWNLETQLHEYLASAKASADREKKLTHALSLSQAEKAVVQKELDELKLTHARFAEDHVAKVRHHDVELGGIRRNLTSLENERGVLHQKVIELTGQNRELALAFTQHRGRLEDQQASQGLSEEDPDTMAGRVTPENSPPPSPTKGTPRHSMLESETLKSSLNHAHRMIQNLKGNIHREKTEKLELKRMLQDARDELESKWADASHATSNGGKRNKKMDTREFRKPMKPGQLGNRRDSRSDIIADELSWTDDEGLSTLNRVPAPFATQQAVDVTEVTAQRTVGGDVHSSNEASASDAFETANEVVTEADSFQTDAEDVSESDELTETESGPVKGKRHKRAATDSITRQPGKRDSFRSTASLSDDEYHFVDIRTPIQGQPQHVRLRMNRAGGRQSRVDDEGSMLESSPASLVNSSTTGTPVPPRQSLYAELENLGASDGEESATGTPSRGISGTSVAHEAPGSTKYIPTLQHGVTSTTAKGVTMVDASVMTDEQLWSVANDRTSMHGIAADTGLEGSQKALDPQSLAYVTGDTNAPSLAASWHQNQFPNQLHNQLGVGRDIFRPISLSTYSDRSSQHDPDIDAKLAKFPTPPLSSKHTPMHSINDQRLSGMALSMSVIISEHVDPVADAEADEILSKRAVSALAPISANGNPLAFSSIQSVNIHPLLPVAPTGDTDGDSVTLEPHSVFGYAEGMPEQRVLERIPASVQASAGSLEDGIQESGRNPSAATEGPPFPTEHTHAEDTALPSARHAISSDVSDAVYDMPLALKTHPTSQTTLPAHHNDARHQSTTERSVPNTGQGAFVADMDSSTAMSPALHVRRSQDSFGSVGRARSKMVDPDFEHDTISLRRPASANSNRGSVSGSHPPLPNDHKQVIAAAARSGSISRTHASMGPPLLPASAYRTNPTFRPRTPSQTAGASPAAKGSTTPRAVRMGSTGTADVFMTAPPLGRSRQSSVSSFVSEIDNRFNIGRNGMPMPHGMDSGTDPRMIQAITQTMIGEYLWKYTRKAGRGEMSENRHRRYFWVHPYTRTLYWSDCDPSQAGRAELKAKSVAIEAVRVVTDDNPMPPGLHRKSLVILTPGRAVKFTATTGQRHETWFNALSYLLLRSSDNSGLGDTESSIANGLSRQDVEEFNPSHHNHSTRRGTASLSSYNSRTTRNESPTRQLSNRMSVTAPSLANRSSAQRAPVRTFSRISHYLRQSKDDSPQVTASQSKRHGAIATKGSIYEASEVHDSAEDLREIIEKQDRESDRLENVRACCDGKHDVGNLHGSRRGRHSHANQVTG